MESLRGTWVLLADDDRASRQLLADILEHCGALVTTVGSAADALGVMRHVKPDVLVTSLVHAGDDAEWLIRQVRGLKPEDGGMVPAVMVTDAAPCGGFDAHLTHPFDPWDLCRLITSITNTS